MKSKISFFITCALFSILIFSCNGIFLDDLKNDNNQSSASINNIPKNCVPVYIKINNQKNLRSVLVPDFDSISVLKYKIIATSDTYGTKEFEFNSTQNTLPIYLELNTQWTIKVNGYKSDTISDDTLVLSGTKVITTGQEAINCSIEIKPILDSSLTGSVSVTVLFNRADVTYTVSTYLDDTLKVSGNIVDATVNSQTRTYSFENVSVGNRVIKLKIVNSEFPNSPVYKIINANVYSNLESSKVFTATGTNDGKIIFSQDDLTPETLDKYALYVLGTSDGSDDITSDEDACGVFRKEKAIKFNTVQDAVNFVEAVDPNGTVESSIFIDGVIMQEPLSGTESLVTIGDGTNSPKIKIIGNGSSATLFVNTVSSTLPARGIYVNSNATVSISRVTISSGVTVTSENGGGIYNKGTLTLENVTISNSESQRGGGIYSNGTLAMTNCTITNNKASNYGGGIFSEGSLTMNDCAVTENNASLSGGGIYNTGEATLNDVNIEENTALNSGGGIYAEQGSDRLIMQGGSIYKNVAGSVSSGSGNGGGLRFRGQKGSSNLNSYQCQSYLDNVTITENSASGSGDGVYIISGAYLDLSMCTVIDNDTQDIGLQGYLYLSEPQAKIGKIYCSNISDSVVHNVGIYVHGSFSNDKDSPDDKVEVTLQGYEDGLTLLTKTVKSGESNFDIAGLVDWFKLPVTDYEIVANGKEGQLKYIGTPIEDYSNFDHAAQMVKVEGKTFNYDNSSGKSSFVNGANTINSFYISKTEITQKVYKSVMSGITITDSSDTLCENPSLCVQRSAEYALPIDEDKQDSRPVDNVTWYDAIYFCNKLSELKGRDPVYTIEDIVVGTDGDTDPNDPYLHIKGATVTIDNTKNGYRLPTRSEWEFAFRGGNPDVEAWNYCYSGKNSASYTQSSNNDSVLDEIAWYCFNNDYGTTGTLDVTNSAEGSGSHPVATRAPNTLGLYDMSGNVYEWVEDLVMNGSNRILMGGSWRFEANRCSWKADLMHAQEKDSYAHYGFRIVCNE